MYACQTAVDSFQTILDTLGGESEIERAKDLMKRVKVVPDNPSFRTQCLPTTGKIKERAKVECPTHLLISLYFSIIKPKTKIRIATATDVGKIDHLEKM